VTGVLPGHTAVAAMAAPAAAADLAVKAPPLPYVAPMYDWSGLPVEQYWSATAYDGTTHAMVRNVSRASRSSQIPEMKKNADGSIDVYFGPATPAGQGCRPHQRPSTRLNPSLSNYSDSDNYEYQ
jgi:hypothetical protein